MKKRITIVAGFLSISLWGFSQFNSEFLKYTDHRNHFSAYGDYEFNSNSLTNKFIQKFYQGGYIDSSLKETVSAKMSGHNYMGGVASFGFNAFFGKDSSSFAWLIGIKNQEIANAAYTQDFFNLAFYGNSMYKGRRAYLNNSNINYMKFQELKLGFVWTDVDTVGKMGGALSFLKGQNMFQFATRDTTFLYTAPDATQLELEANFSLVASDSAKKSMAAFNGSGLSADLFVELPYKSKLGASKFIITVNNLGFIQWNNKTVHYTVDSLFKFDGYNINNLSDLSDSTFSAINRDSTLNAISEVVNEKIITNLPMNFLVIHQIDFNKKYSLRVGLRHIFNGNYKPFLFLDNRFKFTRSVSAGLMLSYGGYGKFSSGLYFEINLKEKWFVKIGSNSLQGFIDTKNSIGQSAYLTLSKTLR
jgi:hypothetical protein